MKLLKFSVIRAIAALIVGVLLFKYDEAVLKGLTIALGAMFLIAGVVSLVGWVNSRRKSTAMHAVDTSGGAVAAEPEDGQPMFPIAGLGSLLLGLILALTRSDEYLTWALYLLGAVLVLGALNMLMNLNAARKMEPLRAWVWLPPCVIVVAAVVAMIRGIVPVEVCTTILGVAAIAYAILEVIYSIILGGISRRYEKTQVQVRRAAEKQVVPAEKFDEAETV
jgi:uncharacterized membrane protein HdeD (DUF308 family)